MYTVPGLPVIGKLFYLIKNSSRQLELMLEMRAALNEKGDRRPLSLTVPFMRMTELLDPASLEYIQSSKLNF